MRAAAIAILVISGTAAADPCEQVTALAAKKDLVHAALAAAHCDDDAITKPLAKRLLAANLGSVEIVSAPPGLIVEIDALPGEKIELPATVWLPPGSYVARVTVDGAILTNAIEVRAHSRGTSIFNAPPKAVAKTDPQKVDFADEGGSEAVEQTTAPPPDLKHPPLTPDKFRGITSATGPQIDDPLEHGIPRGADAGSRAWSLGGRVGGGMFDDALASARAGLALAAVARFAIDGDALADGRIFVDARLDWSRRGTSAVDTLGLAPAIGATFARTGIGALAATLGPRLDTRLESTANHMAVARLGVSAIVGLDLALASAPISAGVRYERGLTAQVPGAHDSAVIVEVGLDWR